MSSESDALDQQSPEDSLEMENLKKATEVSVTFKLIFTSISDNNLQHERSDILSLCFSLLRSWKYRRCRFLQRKTFALHYILCQKKKDWTKNETLHRRKINRPCCFARLPILGVPRKQKTFASFPPVFGKSFLSFPLGKSSFLRQRYDNFPSLSSLCPILSYARHFAN